MTTFKLWIMKIDEKESQLEYIYKGLSHFENVNVSFSSLL